jgi:hypothetical protein
MKRSSVFIQLRIISPQPRAFDADTEIGVSVAAKGRSSGDRTAATANRTSTPVWRLRRVLLPAVFFWVNPIALIR